MVVGYLLMRARLKPWKLFFFISSYKFILPKTRITNKTEMSTIRSNRETINLWSFTCLFMEDQVHEEMVTVCISAHFLACVQTITKLWLVPSAKQRRDPCSGPPTDSTNYRKCVSNLPSTWSAITSLATNKTKVFFNWPIVVRTQIWVHSWKSRTRISALFRRRS